MQKRAESEYREGPTPPVFWVLYVFLGFALTCMGLAAHALLGDLLRTGDWIDKVLVGVLYSCPLLYLVIGFWLAFTKKYVRYGGAVLKVGRSAGTATLWERRLPKNEISAIEVINRKPAANYAELRHDDAQYYIKGHWRIVAWRKTGGSVTVDKHTEREMLGPLHGELCRWLQS